MLPNSWGYVTTFFKKDLPMLNCLLKNTPPPVEQAGLLPTADQLEIFSYYLPDLSLSQILDIFVSISVLDESKYFMCDINKIRVLSEVIQHIPMSVRTKYLFCLAPVRTQSLLSRTMFIQDCTSDSNTSGNYITVGSSCPEVDRYFYATLILYFAKKYSENEEISYSFVTKIIHWPQPIPKKIEDLHYLEEIFECLELYLWIGNRFPNSFPHMTSIRTLQHEVDHIIMDSLIKLIPGRIDSTDVAVHDGRRTKLEYELIRTGVLTPEILDRLKKEWIDNVNEEVNKQE